MLKINNLRGHNRHCSFGEKAVSCAFCMSHCFPASLLFVFTTIIAKCSEQSKRKIILSFKTKEGGLYSKVYHSGKIIFWKSITRGSMMPCIILRLPDSRIAPNDTRRRLQFAYLCAWPAGNACAPARCRAAQSTSKQFFQELASFVS